MQIVIDMPECTFESVKKYYEQNQECYALCAYVANGTPLPKGHGRLTDADEAIQKLCGKSCGCTLKECGYEVPCFSVQRINSAPTIIEADKEEE